MKKITTILLVIVALCTMIIPAYASENEVTPRFNNTIQVSTSFNIESDGLAVASYSFIGYTGIATKVVINSKIEKKFLWWWNDVDGAEWVDEINDDVYAGEHTHQLTKSGTYRLVYEYTVYGTGGDPDVISNNIETEY